MFRRSFLFQSGGNEERVRVVELGGDRAGMNSDNVCKGTKGGDGRCELGAFVADREERTSYR